MTPEERVARSGIVFDDGNFPHRDQDLSIDTLHASEEGGYKIFNISGDLESAIGDDECSLYDAVKEIYELEFEEVYEAYPDWALESHASFTAFIQRKAANPDCPDWALESDAVLTEFKQLKAANPDYPDWALKSDAVFTEFEQHKAANSDYPDWALESHALFARFIQHKAANPDYPDWALESDAALTKFRQHGDQIRDLFVSYPAWARRASHELFTVFIQHKEGCPAWALASHALFEGFIEHKEGCPAWALESHALFARFIQHKEGCPDWALESRAVFTGFIKHKRGCPDWALASHAVFAARRKNLELKEQRAQVIAEYRQQMQVDGDVEAQDDQGIMAQVLARDHTARARDEARFEKGLKNIDTFTRRLIGGLIVLLLCGGGLSALYVLGKMPTSFAVFNASTMVLPIILGVISVIALGYIIIKVVSKPNLNKLLAADNARLETSLVTKNLQLRMQREKVIADCTQRLPAIEGGEAQDDQSITAQVLKREGTARAQDEAHFEKGLNNIDTFKRRRIGGLIVLLLCGGGLSALYVLGKMPTSFAVFNASTMVLPMILGVISLIVLGYIIKVVSEPNLNKLLAADNARLETSNRELQQISQVSARLYSIQARDGYVLQRLDLLDRLKEKFRDFAVNGHGSVAALEQAVETLSRNEERVQAYETARDKAEAECKHEISCAVDVAGPDAQQRIRALPDAKQRIRALFEQKMSEENDTVHVNVEACADSLADSLQALGLESLKLEESCERLSKVVNTVLRECYFPGLFEACVYPEGRPADGDRMVTYADIALSDECADDFDLYLENIKTQLQLEEGLDAWVQTGQIGSRLATVLSGYDRDNVGRLTRDDLIDALVKTKNAMLFAEDRRHFPTPVAERETPWTHEEYRFLSKIVSVVDDVTVHSSTTYGHHYAPDAAADPVQTGISVIFAHGALFNGAGSDLPEHCGGSGSPTRDYLKAKLTRNLLPALLVSNDKAGPDGFVFSTSMLGAGQFAGLHGKLVSEQFESILQEIILANIGSLDQLRGVVLGSARHSEPKPMREEGPGADVLWRKIPYAATGDQLGLLSTPQSLFPDDPRITKDTKLVAWVAGDPLSKLGNDLLGGFTSTAEGGIAYSTDVITKADFNVNASKVVVRGQKGTTFVQNEMERRQGYSEVRTIKVGTAAPQDAVLSGLNCPIQQFGGESNVQVRRGIAVPREGQSVAVTLSSTEEMQAVNAGDLAPTAVVAQSPQLPAADDPNSAGKTSQTPRG